MNIREQPQTVSQRTEPGNAREIENMASLIGPANRPARFTLERSNGRKQSVDLHIEQLVLHGFDPRDRYLIGETVERELTRLLTEQVSPTITEEADTPLIDGGVFELSFGSCAESIGLQLSEAIYGGLSK
jgi:hypothetical protein